MFNTHQRGRPRSKSRQSVEIQPDRLPSRSSSLGGTAKLRRSLRNASRKDKADVDGQVIVVNTTVKRRMSFFRKPVKDVFTDERNTSPPPPVPKIGFPYESMPKRNGSQDKPFLSDAGAPNKPDRKTAATPKKAGDSPGVVRGRVALVKQQFEAPSSPCPLESPKPLQLHKPQLVSESKPLSGSDPNPQNRTRSPSKSGTITVFRALDTLDRSAHLDAPPSPASRRRSSGPATQQAVTAEQTEPESQLLAHSPDTANFFLLLEGMVERYLRSCEMLEAERRGKNWRRELGERWRRGLPAANYFPPWARGELQESVIRTVEAGRS